MVANFRHLIVVTCIGAALPPAIGQAQTEADRLNARPGVVMIQTKLPAGSAFGAGIAVAASGQDVYVVTANHLLRRGGVASEIKVQVTVRPGEWFEGKLLDLQDDDLDLGAILVRLPAGVTPAMLKGGASPMSASSMERGSDVFALGYPAQRAWDLPVQPDKLARVTSLRLIFQSQYVRPGNSGGALLDGCGHIVGMVVVSDPPEAEAIRIESVLDAVSRWGIRQPLFTLAPASTCGSTPASTSFADNRRNAPLEPANPGSAPSLSAAPPPSVVQPPPAAGTPAVAYARLLDETAAAIRTNRPLEANALVDQMIALDPARPEGWALRGAMMVDVNNYPAAYQAYDSALQRGGVIYFRLAHDHGSGLVPCVGGVTVSQAGVKFTGENGGHQLQWPAGTITEVALNPFYGVAIGMLHVRAQGGRGVETFNFAVVRVTDVQVINRRPEAELLVALINRVRQGAAR
jgi:hypothetical protein